LRNGLEQPTRTRKLGRRRRGVERTRMVGPTRIRLGQARRAAPGAPATAAGTRAGARAARRICGPHAARHSSPRPPRCKGTLSLTRTPPRPLRQSLTRTRRKSLTRTPAAARRGPVLDSDARHGACGTSLQALRGGVACALHGLQRSPRKSSQKGLLSPRARACCSPLSPRTRAACWLATVRAAYSRQSPHIACIACNAHPSIYLFTHPSIFLHTPRTSTSRSLITPHVRRTRIRLSFHLSIYTSIHLFTLLFTFIYSHITSRTCDAPGGQGGHAAPGGAAGRSILRGREGEGERERERGPERTIEVRENRQ
jgi:hypothetical protein